MRTSKVTYALREEPGSKDAANRLGCSSGPEHCRHLTKRRNQHTQAECDHSQDGMCVVEVALAQISHGFNSKSESGQQEQDTEVLCQQMQVEPPAKQLFVVAQEASNEHSTWEQHCPAHKHHHSVDRQPMLCL
jgi:hypothetical protein